ncbi:MAG: GNAT family N-acetyltransferase [Candidatus Thorarchaeota archaeon]|nr:GNAT family N-acetyltransferase [Candidatus Thorarchaeota archaeon]
MTELELITEGWNESIIDEVSNFVFNNRIGVYRNTEDADGIRRYLTNIQDRFPAEKILMVRRKGTLCGWASLNRDTKSIVELGRWQPIIEQTDDEDEIANLLLEGILDYAKSNEITRIDAKFSEINDNNHEDYQRCAKWFNGKGIGKSEDDVYLTLQLEHFKVPRTDKLGYWLVWLQYADEEDLYKCYHDTFSKSQDTEFLNSSESQKREKFEQAIHSDLFNKYLSFVWKDGERIFGFVIVHSRNEEEHIHLFGILDEYRRKGIAKNMLLKTIKEMIAGGCKMVSIGVDAKNTTAYNLYKKIGFNVNSRMIVHSINFK